MKRSIPKAVYESMEFSYAFLDFLRLTSAIRRFRPDVVYERYNLFFPSGIWASRLFDIPLLLEVNAPLYEERQQFSGGIALAALAGWSQRYVWRGASVVLPVTGVLARNVMHAGVPEARIHVIHNGIDPDCFARLPSKEDAKSRLRLAAGLVVGFVGFMRGWHGLDRVIRFVAQNRDLDLHAVFVGDGPVRGALEELARQLGVSDRVTVTGILSRDKIPDTIAAFDVALQPAVVEYASPLKLFEYLAAGLPVVAPDSDNIREVLFDGENALLFKSGSDSGFTDALGVLCRDEALRRKLGEAARRTIVDRGLTWSANAERVIDLAQQLVSAPGA
jgi:glycosyltransferase involved in cell wall biosynthesis